MAIHAIDSHAGLREGKSIGAGQQGVLEDLYEDSVICSNNQTYLQTKSISDFVNQSATKPITGYLDAALKL